MISRKTIRQRRESGHNDLEKAADYGPSRPWPVQQSRKPVRWYPAWNRLITLVRTQSDSYVLPPALVKKASWRD